LTPAGASGDERTGQSRQLVAVRGILPATARRQQRDTLQEATMKSKSAKGSAGQGKDRSPAKKKLPRRPQDTVQDLRVRHAAGDAVKGGIPKQPDSTGWPR
jgi:hypothetical protein